MSNCSRRETADRHRRIAAIMNHFVPVLVAQFCHVHPERDQDIERMARRHAAFGQRLPEFYRLGLGVALPEQFGLQQIEIAKLLVRLERCMIGDVIGGPHEIVEREDQRPVAGMNDPGRDGKILVAMGLAGSQFARGGHQERATSLGMRARRSPAKRNDRGPHIGEYAAKTNAIRDLAQTRAA